MFTPIENFVSVNIVDANFTGDYKEIRSEYQNFDGTISATIREFIKAFENSVSVCDVLVVLQDGSFVIFDFLLLSENSWRDNFGRCASSLADLLPNELFDFRLISRSELDFQY